MPPGVFTTAVSRTVAPKSVAAPASTNETRSTLLLRNLPSSFVQRDLLSFLESCGLKGHFDFVYLPMDFATGSNLGYAFVNFVTAAEALAATALLHGFCSWSDAACHKVLAVCWSTPLQGLEALIAHFRNSRVMHGSVPDCYRPVLLEKGVRVAFPKATKRLRAPC
jgi:RNA recognition motif-containing protein